MDRRTRTHARAAFGRDALALAVVMIMTGCAGSLPETCPPGSDASLVFLVVDARGVPLSGVEVAASGGDAPGHYVTDEAGVVVIECVRSGSYRLSFAKAGFSTHQMVAEAFPGSAPTRTVYLQPGRF